MEPVKIILFLILCKNIPRVKHVAFSEEKVWIYSLSSLHGFHHLGREKNHMFYKGVFSKKGLIRSLQIT